MKDLTILITGGTGSFGIALTEELIRHEPKAIRIYSRNEYWQFQMAQQFPHCRYLIGDVRDYERLVVAMRKCDVVFHAAALKHISTCEYNPIEAIRTNIDGSINVVNACIEAKVPRCLFISSDKAVYPMNLYGATKMVGEQLFIHGNVYGKTKFSCVRFGNFFGSRGSVADLWSKQKENGEITLTDGNCVRYWITFEEATKFAVSCAYEMQGGEIFIPIMPSMSMDKMAEYIAPGVKKKSVGIKHGEKMKEDLLTQEELSMVEIKFDRMVIRGWQP